MPGCHSEGPQEAREIGNQELMNFKGKCKVLHLEENSPMQQYRPGADWLESSSAEKDLVDPGWQQVKHESACALAAKAASCLLGCTNRSVARQSKEVIFPLYAVFVSLRTEYHTRFWAPQYEEDAVRLEQVQWRATNIRGQSTRQEELCFVNPKGRRQRGDLIAVLNYLTGG